MKYILLSAALTLTLTTQAQDSTRQLEEVQVRGRRVVRHGNGLRIYPSETERNHSNNTYSLLAKTLPGEIRVDPIARSVTPVNGDGSVRIYVNDRPATTEDLLSIDLTAIIRIEYTRHPSIRHGENVAAAINIVVRNPTAGYVVGTDLTSYLSRIGGDHRGFIRYNNGPHEWAADLSADYDRQEGATSIEKTDYHLNDGSVTTITRSGKTLEAKSANHSMALSFTHTDSLRVFQSRLRYNGSIHPSVQTNRIIVDGPAPSTATKTSRTSTVNPQADIYFRRTFSTAGILTVNVTGSLTHTTADDAYDEARPYAYHVRGKAWKVYTEARYEKNGETLNMEWGLQDNFAQTHNNYDGDIDASVRSVSNEAMLYGNLSGRWAGIEYRAGLGLSTRYYRQGQHSQTFTALRPNISASYSFDDRWGLSYVFDRTVHVSRIAMTHDITIAVNPYERIAGNPDLKPTKVTSHSLTLSYNSQRLSASLNTYAKLNHHPNLHRYIRTDDNIFIDTQENQPFCNVFSTGLSIRHQTIPDHLVLDVYLGYYHFDNKGNDYRHRQNILFGSASVEIYIGNWSLTLYGDTGYGFTEGERRSQNAPTLQLQSAWKTGHLQLSLFVVNPGMPRPEILSTRLLNRHLSKAMTIHNPASGNFVGVNLTWRFQRGKDYKRVDRRIATPSGDTGILRM